ncbi:hypothetical protein HBA47_05295 [Kingella kingae]|nr:hypothetical protein HBA47_05295 [Kingella kingae]
MQAAFIVFMQKFILLRGHEGSGKSTFAQQKIAEFQRDFPNTHIVHIDNDLVLTDTNGHYHFDFERFAQAHRDNMARQQAALEQGQREPNRPMLIINANPNQKSKTCQTQIQAACTAGFVVEVYRLHNFFDNIHGVSQDDVLRGYARLDNNPVQGEVHVPAIRPMSPEQGARLANLR